MIVQRLIEEVNTIQDVVIQFEIIPQSKGNQP